MRHTPEPWYVSADNEPVRVTTVYPPPAYNMIANWHPFVFGTEADGRVWVPRDADSRRIVVCVNACAGIEDPAAELARLREQVRVLREELEHAMHTIGNHGGDVTNLRAALAATTPTDPPAAFHGSIPHDTNGDVK